MNQIKLFKSDFERDGYVVVREFLKGVDLKLLKDNLDRYIRDVVPLVAAGDAFYEDRQRPETLKQLHRIEQDAFFKDYLDHPMVDFGVGLARVRSAFGARFATRSS